jgi:hypothetical protein
MSVPDNSGSSNEGGGVAAPGWYFAQGDPPGTERYWNGQSWDGTYRAVGAFSPSAATARPEGFPTGAKTLVWVITVLKAIPLLLIGIALAVFDTIVDELEQETDIDIADERNVFLIVGFLVIIVGAILLAGQIRAVTMEKTRQAVIWAGIISLIDVVNTGSALLDGEPFSIGIAGLVLAAQGSLFWWMLRLDRARAASSA